jgi:hypothetical protein
MEVMRLRAVFRAPDVMDGSHPRPDRGLIPCHALRP